MELLTSADHQILRREAGVVTAVGANDRVVGEPPIDFKDDSLWLHRYAGPGGTARQRIQPFPLPCLGLLEEAAIRLVLQATLQRTQGGCAASPTSWASTG